MNPKERYQEYLKSKHWRNVKRRAKKVFSECLGCGSRKFDLHHRTYCRRGKELLSDLIPLCRKCHFSVHDWLEKNGKSHWESLHALKALHKWTRKTFGKKRAGWEKTKRTPSWDEKYKWDTIRKREDKRKRKMKARIGFLPDVDQLLPKYGTKE